MWAPLKQIQRHRMPRPNNILYSSLSVLYQERYVWDVKDRGVCHRRQRPMLFANDRCTVLTCHGYVTLNLPRSFLNSAIHQVPAIFMSVPAIFHSGKYVTDRHVNIDTILQYGTLLSIVKVILIGVFRCTCTTHFLILWCSCRRRWILHIAFGARRTILLLLIIIIIS